MSHRAAKVRLEGLSRQAMREMARKLNPRQEWLSVADAAEMTGFSIQTVRAWCNAGRIPFSTVNGGSAWRIRADALDELMSKYEAKP